jgi:D-amino peptidase
MAGTPDAPLCHTYSSRTVQWYELNGERIGEFGCRTLLAASARVPTIFLSGDDKAVAEAEVFLPGIETVTTKIGGGIERVLHLSAAESQRLIREGVRRAVKRRGKIRLRRATPPYKLVITLLPGADPKPYLDEGGRMTGKSKVVFRSSSLLDLPI